jgi:hypothetical protein
VAIRALATLILIATMIVIVGSDAEAALGSSV